jgi:hypothetical protein
MFFNVLTMRAACAGGQDHAYAARKLEVAPTLGLIASGSGTPRLSKETKDWMCRPAAPWRRGSWRFARRCLLLAVRAEEQPRQPAASSQQGPGCETHCDAMRRATHSIGVSAKTVSSKTQWPARGRHLHGSKIYNTATKGRESSI